MKTIVSFVFKKALKLFVHPRLMLMLFGMLGVMHDSLAAHKNLNEAFAYCKSSYPSIFEAKNAWRVLMRFKLKVCIQRLQLCH